MSGIISFSDPGALQDTKLCLFTPTQEDENKTAESHPETNVPYTKGSIFLGSDIQQIRSH